MLLDYKHPLARFLEVYVDGEKHTKVLGIDTDTEEIIEVYTSPEGAVLNTVADEAPEDAYGIDNGLYTRRRKPDKLRLILKLGDGIEYDLVRMKGAR